MKTPCNRRRVSTKTRLPAGTTVVLKVEYEEQVIEASGKVIYGDKISACESSRHSSSVMTKNFLRIGLLSKSSKSPFIVGMRVVDSVQ